MFLVGPRAGEDVLGRQVYFWWVLGPVRTFWGTSKYLVGPRAGEDVLGKQVYVLQLPGSEPRNRPAGRLVTTGTDGPIAQVFAYRH
jgi:hypothetical protein